MDNKITKKRINDHLEYDWYKYLIILVAGIVLFYFLFSQINRTRDYEDITFFISCYEADDNGFSDRVKRDMASDDYKQNGQKKYGENVLRSLTLETQNPLDSNYITLLQTHGQISSDVLIVGKSILENAGPSYLELTDALLRDYLLPDGVQIEDLDYYAIEHDGRAYRMGIRVSDFSRLPFETDWRKIQSYKDKYDEMAEENQPDTEFYLVINRSSVNIGPFGKKSKDKNAQTLFAVNRFIKYYNREVPQEAV